MTKPSNKIYVTDHAIRRYVERVLGVRAKAKSDKEFLAAVATRVSLEELRTTIVLEVLCARHVTMMKDGNALYRTERGFYVVCETVDGKSLVTVLKPTARVSGLSSGTAQKIRQKARAA